MAKALLVCRRKSEDYDYSKKLREIANRIAPDNATVSPPYVYNDSSTSALIYNPKGTIRVNEASLCLGLSNGGDDLFKIDAPLPIGSFALFRNENSSCQVSTDYGGSRTIWYYIDNSLFLASTSQRMIVSYLGNFDLNIKACGWFLTSGTLGPGTSWDTRIKMLPPRTSFFLDKKTWNTRLERDLNFDFHSESKNLGFNHYRDTLDMVLAGSVSSLKIDSSKWTLALSGGMDSRGLLYHLEKENLNAVTWGLQSSLAYKRSDAKIAERLAAETGIGHYYAPTDYVDGSFPKVLDRFLGAGEGRIDHLGGYLDGLEIWGGLSKSGRGVIRGYDAFGRKPPVINDYQVHRTCNLTTSEYTLGGTIPEKFAVTKSDVPQTLNQKDGESLEDWRDRLWLQYRTPITTASLEDIKLAYVEVINPLLTEDIIRLVQNLPTKLRADKKVWKSIVSKLYPQVPFANMDSTQEVGEILNQRDVREYVCDELSQQGSNSIFPKDFTEFLVANFNTNKSSDAARQKFRKWIIAHLPLSAENFFRKRLAPSAMNNQWLATRTFMISKIIEMYTTDSKIDLKITWT